MSTMMTTRKAAIDLTRGRYPLGSTWDHNSLGRVVVVGYDVSRSPADSYCGVAYDATPRVHDGTREWTCYSPAHDLAGTDI